MLILMTLKRANCCLVKGTSKLMCWVSKAQHVVFLPFQLSTWPLLYRTVKREILRNCSPLKVRLMMIHDAQNLYTFTLAHVQITFFVGYEENNCVIF